MTSFCRSKLTRKNTTVLPFYDVSDQQEIIMVGVVCTVFAVTVKDI